VAGQPAELIAIAYPDLGAAQLALAAAEKLEPRDAVIVFRGPDGHVQQQQTRQTSIGEGAVAGGTVGLLVGLLVGLPIAAAVAGLAAGGGFGIRDTGIPDQRLRALGESLDADHAVLCVLADDVPALTEALAPFGGVVLP
jgi:uncharacterized membrane protein